MVIKNAMIIAISNVADVRLDFSFTTVISLDFKNVMILLIDIIFFKSMCFN